MVCGGLWWFVVVVCSGGLWWFVVVGCDGLWWFFHHSGGPFSLGVIVSRLEVWRGVWGGCIRKGKFVVVLVRFLDGGVVDSGR